MKDLAGKILARKNADRREIDNSDMRFKKRRSTWGIVKYMFLPDLKTRFRQLGLRLGSFAHFLALIFYSCRLIPAGHPVLQSANIGYFGFSDVIATAAANLQIRRENTDQIIMFGAVIVSMVLLVANGLAITAFAIFDVGDAFAQEGGAAATASASLFSAPHPDRDLALLYLDRVFGAPNVPFFHVERPNIAEAALGSSAIKEALYHMLGLYSTAMMVVAVIIVLYYAFTVVGESAMTGQPFGKRFNSFWAPIRLVIGLGLLVPLAGGLNAAQYMTLYAAKLGSGFASKAWSGFVEKLAETDLISENVANPEVSTLIFQIVRFETCRAVVNKYNGGTQVQVAPSGETPSTPMGALDGNNMGNFVVPEEIDTTSGGMIAEANNGAQPGKLFRWNKMGTSGIRGFFASNEPAACGEIFVPRRLRNIAQGEHTVMGGERINASLENIHNTYTQMVQNIIVQVRPVIVRLVESSAAINMTPEQFTQELDTDGQLSTLKETLIRENMTVVDNALDQFKREYENAFNQEVRQKISEFDRYGWMGAGMFYTQISDLNGALGRAITDSFPRITGDMVALPSGEEMEEAASETWIGQPHVTGYTWDNETTIAMMKNLNAISRAFAMQGANPEDVGARAYRQSWIMEMLVDMFGGTYIRAFRESSQSNPLADLMALGQGMMTKGLDYIVWILGLLAAGSVAGIVATGLATLVTGGAGLPLFLGSLALTALSSMMKSIAMFMIFAAGVGMAVGMIIAYMVPILPFIFFFFAITGWILEVIEAMVGLPLWALAHIRIDGDGLPGQAAQTGYTILFGILVRPFVILFAFIVGIILYSAAMLMLKQMFSFYAGTIGQGEDHVIDYLMFSGMYAVMSFTLAMLCFKQCDQMSNNIMRWFGGSDPRYDDGQPDPTSTFQTVAGAGAYVATQGMNQLGQSVSQMGDAMSNNAGSMMGGRAQTKAQLTGQISAAKGRLADIKSKPRAGLNAAEQAALNNEEGRLQSEISTLEAKLARFN